jgi:hypothetical protein
LGQWLLLSSAPQPANPTINSQPALIRPAGLEVNTRFFAKLRSLAAAAISPISGLRTGQRLKMDDERITPLLCALVAKFDAGGPEPAVENMEALVDALEMAHYQGVRLDLVDAFWKTSTAKCLQRFSAPWRRGDPS